MPAPALAVVMPYYRNPRMLYRQCLIWLREWSDAQKDQLQVVIVDDGSPCEAAAGVVDDISPHWPGMPRIEVYRVLEDRPWHQHGARNLGAHVARAPWLLMTDMDHVIPPDTLSECLAAIRLADEDHVFTFGRVDAPLEPWRAGDASTMAKTTRADGSLKHHVNSFLVSRARYWKIGGYDEDYCGIYGTDKLFRQRLFAGATTLHWPHAPLIRVAREVIPDASTRDVDRKEGRENGAKKRIAAAKAERGEADVIKTLQFEWERVI